MTSLLTLFACWAAACQVSGGQSSLPAPRQPRPTRENVALYYQNVEAGTDLTKVGKVSVVIGQGGSSTARAIQATGAKAFRYVQVYWLPTGSTIGGLNLSAAGVGFCDSSGSPVTGRTDSRGRPWVFVDLNERALLLQLLAMFQSIKRQGWDGVFFDRGLAALTGVDDPSVRNVWSSVSTCTSDPAQPQATFADAFANVLGLPGAVGLGVILNYGVSPFDPARFLRPNPRDPACLGPDLAGCPHLTDVWPHLRATLDEAISHPRDIAWPDELAANRVIEQNGAAGRRVIGLLTSAALGGDFSRESVLFEWSKVKLFPIPVAVGTGDDNCAETTASSICNRHGVFPDLANVAFGAPRDGVPHAAQCEVTKPENCVWSRRYEWGASVVNVTPRPQTYVLNLGFARCRYVRDIASRKAMAGNKCVSSVTISLPPWSGRPVEFAARRW